MTRFLIALALIFPALASASEVTGVLSTGVSTTGVEGTVVTAISTTTASVWTGSVETGGGTLTASIPAGTTITGSVSWGGALSLPTVTTATVTVSGSDTSVTSAIAIGSSDSDLTFDKAAKLTFLGQAGKRVGWYNHAGTFAEITASCSDNTQTTNDALAAGSSCKIDSDADLVVWTKHFSTFVTYTQTPTPVVSSSSSSGGGGGGGGGGGSILAGSGASNPLPGATTGGTVTPPPQGQVLGAAVYNFAKNLTVGSRGADVTALQQFLIDGGFKIAAGATGYFGTQTKAAVVAFQKAHKINPTLGYVGPLTRAELNKGQTIAKK